MLWIPLTLLTALAIASRDVSIKKFRELAPREVAALELVAGLPPLALGLLLIPVPDLDAGFFTAFFVSLPIQILAYVLHLRAIKASPISLTVPFLAFTPAFMLVTGYLILGEKASLVGGLGVLMIVAGSYALNIDRRGEGWLAPIQAIGQERGSRLMLAVAFLYSFLAVLGKMGILHSSPLFFSYTFFLAVNASVLGILYMRGRLGKAERKKLVLEKGKAVWLGGLVFIEITCHALAIVNATAVYMIALKRTSLLMGVALARVVLKEEKFGQRAPGAVLMFLGVAVITVFGK